MKKILSLSLSIVMIISMCVPALAVSATPVLSDQEQIESLAYMNLEQSDPVLKEKIISAREEIIFNQSWVADGVSGFIYDELGNIIEEVPQFSDLFPDDWEIPTFNDQQNIEPILSTQSSSLVSSGDTMFFYNDWLTLSLPSSTTNTPSFCTARTSGTVNGSPYVITSISAYATFSYTTSATYNVGFSNNTTGEALAWYGPVQSGKPAVIFPPSGITVAIRASMNNSSGYTSGDWWMTVKGDMEYT